MLSTIRSAAGGIAIVAILLVMVFTAGCGRDDSSRSDYHKVSKSSKPAPTVTQPPVTTPPVQVAEVKPVPAEPEIPKTVTYEEAEAAYMARKYDLAVKLFARYTVQKDQNQWGFYMLGLSAWKAGDLEYAEGSFNKALELAPGHVKSMLNLARVLMETDRPAEALAQLDNAAVHDPESGVVHRLRGRALAELGRIDEAAHEYRAAIRIDGRDAWSMNNLALLLIDQERFDEALGPLARAVQIDSNVAVFWNNLGMALERTGHIRAAQDAYSSSLLANEGYDKAYANLVRIEQVDEQPGTPPVDLIALAEQFAGEVEGWQVAEADTASVVTDTTETVAQAVGIAGFVPPDTTKTGKE
jgi:Flp pilus assembly protein TadD